MKKLLPMLLLAVLSACGGGDPEVDDRVILPPGEFKCNAEGTSCVG